MFPLFLVLFFKEMGWESLFHFLPQILIAIYYMKQNKFLDLLNELCLGIDYTSISLMKFGFTPASFFKYQN